MKMSEKAKEFDKRWDCIPLDEIYSDNQFNCRGDFSDSECKSLAKHIAAEGLFTPILLRPKPGPNGEKYTIVAGHRRKRAYEMLGAEAIPANVQDLDDDAARRINLIENLERKDLTLWQEARALIPFFDAGKEVRDIMKDINQTENWIKIRMLLWELPVRIQELFKDNLLLAKDVKPLSKLQGDQQLKIAGRLADHRRAGNLRINVNELLPKARKKARRVRSQQEIWAKMEWFRERLITIDSPFVESNGNCIATKALAWASGTIPDSELDDAFVDYVVELRGSEAIEL